MRIRRNWRSAIAATSLSAYRVFCERQGEQESQQAQHSRRLYMFALQACSPGARWRWRFEDGWRWLNYDGAFSINDACRRFGDMNTSWRPRVTELYQAGWLRRLPDKRQDPVTGMYVWVHVPTRVIVPPMRRPQPAKLLRETIPRLRTLYAELDPVDEWTQRFAALLFSTEMLAVVPPPTEAEE